MHIRVDGTRISADGNVVVGGNHDFSKLTFSFDRSWNRFIKFAQFTQKGSTRNVLLVDDRCDLPRDLKPGPFYLDVAGVTPSNNDKAATDYIILHLQRGPVLAPPPHPGMDGSPEHLPPPPDIPRYTDLYDELNQRIHDACIRGGRILLDPSLSKKDMAAEANAVGVALELIRQTISGGDRELNDRLKAQEESNDAQNALINSMKRQMDGAEETAGAAKEKAEEALGAVEALKPLKDLQQETAAKLASQQTALEEVQRKADVAAGIQSGLISQIGETQSAVAVLRTDTDRQEEAISALTLQVASAASDFSSSLQLTSRVSAAESSLVSLKSGLQDLKDGRDVDREITAGLKTEVQTLKEADTRKGTAIEGIRGEVQTVSGALQEVKEGLEALKNGVSSLSSGHQDVGDRVSLTRRRLDLLEAGQRKLENDLHAQSDDIRDAERRLTAVEKVADDARDKTEDHQGRLEGAEDDIRSLKGRFNCLEGTTLPDLQAADRALGKRADCIKDRMDRTEESFETLQSEHRGMLRQLDALASDRDEMRSQVRDAVDTAKAARTLVSQITSQDLNGRLYQAETSLQDCRSAISQSEAGIRRELDALRQRLLRLEENAGGHEDADVHASDVRALQAAIARLEGKLQGLDESKAEKDDLALVQGTVREYGRETDRLKAAVTVLEEKAGANLEDIQKLLTGMRELREGEEGRAAVIRQVSGDMETLRTSFASMREASIAGDAALSDRITSLERVMATLQDSISAVRRTCVRIAQGDSEAGKMLVVGANGDVTTVPPKGLIVLSESGLKQYYISVNDSGQLQLSEIL